MIASFLISLAINILIGEIQGRRTKLTGAKAEAARVPTATEDRVLPYGVGVFQVAGNVVWEGDQLAKAIKEDVQVSLFSSKSVAVGYEQHLGLWMTLVGAPCSKVLEVKYGEDIAWTGEHTLTNGVSNLAFSYRKREEGEKVDRGIAGTLRFFNSHSDVIANPYVTGQVGEAVPAYPGILHAVWVGPSEGATEETVLGMKFKKFGNGFLGNSPSIQPLTLTVQRFPDLADALPNAMRLTWPVNGSLHDGQVRLALNNWLNVVQNIEEDANPALVLLELLTSRIPGLGPCLNPWNIDTESFLRAAEVLHAEGIGMSASWESSQQFDEILRSICTVALAIPLIDPVTRRISLQLMRETAVPTMTFGDSNVIRLSSFERKVPEELPNVIQLAFEDRENSWAERVAEAKNPAGVKTAGTTITETVEVLGVTRASLALKLASRELRSRCAPLAQVAFEAIVEPGTVMQVGQLIELKHSPLKQTLRLRVTSARYGSLADAQTVRVEALEDVFRPGFGAGSVTPLPPVVGPSEPSPGVSAGGLMLAPYALTGEEADMPLFYALPGADPKPYRVAAQPAAAWTAGYPPTFGESTAMPALAGTFSSALAGAGTSGASLVLEDNSAALAAARGLPAEALLLVGNELLFANGFVFDRAAKRLSMQVRARGVYDTTPAPIGIGAYAVVLTDYVLFPRALKTDAAAGADRLVMRAEAGGDVVEGTDKAYVYAPNTSPARASLPLPPGAVTMAAGQSPAFTEDTATLTYARVSSLSIGWKNRNRDLRAVTSYLDSKDMPAPGAQVCMRIGWKLDNGNYAENDVVRAPVGAALTTLSTTMVPAGERLGRLRIWTEAGGVASRAHVLYFKFSA